MNAAIVYRGPSRIDGAPIVAVVTGLKGDSNNPKTGPMAQLWIIRSDVNPIDALHTGQDASICGDCPLRGERIDGRNVGRACYVAVKNAPLAVFRAMQADRYVEWPAVDIANILRSRGLSIRLGAYGDPCALPIDILAGLTLGVEGWTGYTHQWRDRRFAFYRGLLMASVETAADRDAATLAGWRTFRTIAAVDDSREREIICPASDEAGKRTTCEQCGLCDGARTNDRRKSIAIVVHGAGKRHALTLYR